MRHASACALILSLAITGCLGTSASPDITATTACGLAPLAREISTQARAALAAARGGDRDAMLDAAQAGRDLVDQIVAAAEAQEPQASLDPLFVPILSVAYAGEQASSFFGDAVPSAEDLTSFEATILGALDRSVGRVESEAAAANCPVP